MRKARTREVSVREREISVPGFFRAIAVGAVTLTAACATGAPGPVDQTAINETPQNAEPAFVLEDVMGQSAMTIDDLLGEAALVRREGPGEFRRYVLAQCNLIVIFYPNDAETLNAAHIDAAAKTSEEDKPDLDECLAAGLEPSSVSS